MKGRRGGGGERWAGGKVLWCMGVLRAEAGDSCQEICVSILIVVSGAISISPPNLKNNNKKNLLSALSGD